MLFTQVSQAKSAIMRNLIFASVLALLSACGPTDKQSENQTPADNMQTEAKRDIIAGPEGMLYVDDGGSGGLPVLFLHSFGGSSSHWDNQLQHLRKERRAIAIDLRGHGRSDAPAHMDYNPEALAADVVAVVDSLKLERFVLVGHSFGGATATAYAGLHPERLAGLVLVGTPGKTPGKVSKPIIESLESDQYQKVMDDYMNKLLTNAKPEVRKEVMKNFNKTSQKTSLTIIKAIFQYDPLPMLAKYNGPMLIIYTPAEKEGGGLPTQLPDKPSVMIDSTSHWMQMDKPDEFNNVLDGFLRGLQ
jgi:pimeloyl-ACP methyl ester carboxylesterase